jgi:hypothetical protein
MPKLVQFTRHYGSYNPGESAGFEDAEAARLVAKKVARWPDAPRPAETKKPEPKAEEKPAADPKAPPQKDVTKITK